VLGELGVRDSEGRPAPIRAKVFQHLHNAVAIQKEAVFLDNWNAREPVANVEYRPDRNPYQDLWSGDLAAGLEHYEHRTGVHPDGILIWRLPRDELGGLKSLLKNQYEPVAVVPEPTLSAFYRRTAPSLK
jgi:hypothetical protein